MKIVLFLLILLIISLFESNPGFFLIIGFFILLIYSIVKNIKNAKERELLLSYQCIEDLINNYDPYEFEEYIARIYKILGYKVHTTSKSNDGGYDIIIKGNRSVSLVEVKKYSLNNKIGRDKIQKLHSAVIDYGANSGIFVTTSFFSKPAIEYANRNNIEMVNGLELITKIKSLNGINYKK